MPPLWLWEIALNVLLQQKTKDKVNTQNSTTTPHPLKLNKSKALNHWRPSYNWDRLLCLWFQQRSNAVQGSSPWCQKYSNTPATVSGSEGQLWPWTCLKSRIWTNVMRLQVMGRVGWHLCHSNNTCCLHQGLPNRVHSPDSASSRCCVKRVEIHCMCSRQVRAPLRWTCVENFPGKSCCLRPLFFFNYRDIFFF